MSGSKLSDRSDPREVRVPEGAREGAPARPADALLDLTVHALPSAHAAAAAPSTRAGRWRMLAVLLVCAAPVVASYFTYYVLRPDGRKNFGTLIEPQRPLPAMAVTDLEGRPSDLQAQRGQWLLVGVAGGACDALCERHLYLQRQLRESLGKNKDRLDRVWLVDDTAPVPGALRSGLQGATVLRAPAAALAQWLPSAAGQPVSAHLYVVDPNGNLMLRFPAGLDAASASRAKRDIEQLLRASASWDQAGR